jgi:hypothetical protein
MGATLGAALDNLKPIPCHGDELKAIEHATEASPGDLEEYEPDDQELAELDDEQWEAYKEAFGVNGLRVCEDPQYESAESWYNSLGFHTEDGEGHQSCHPVCPLEYVPDFVPRNPSERKALDYALQAARVARELDGYFESAVALHGEGDEECVQTILRTASGLEKEYGDDPATQALAKQLLIRPL